MHTLGKFARAAAFGRRTALAAIVAAQRAGQGADPHRRTGADHRSARDAGRGDDQRHEDVLGTEQYTAGGRKIELVIADTNCNPDQALTQARRLALQEKVHFLIGPLCGHEGPAVAQVSRETGIPLVMDPAGADNVTKWDRMPTVVRTAISASQLGHPFGEYLYKELGLRNVTFIAPTTPAATRSHGAIKTFTRSRRQGRESSGSRWPPPTTAPRWRRSLGHRGVAVVVVGADRIRLFEAWFNFGYDRKYKLYGGYWLHEDMMPQVDDRAVGLICNSLHYVAGIDTPENKAFVDDYAEVQAPAVLVRRVGLHRRLWTKAAIDSIGGNVEDRAAFLKAMRTVQVKAPRGPLKLDAYDNPIQNVYIASREGEASGPRRPADEHADQDLRGGVAVLDLDAGGIPRARPVQALMRLSASRRAAMPGRPSRSDMMSSIILQAINGISLAALLFLLASGFTLTFGLMRVVNMAYGAYYLLGGYVGYSVARRPAASSSRSLGGGLTIVVLGFLRRPLSHPPARRQPPGAGAAHGRRRLRDRRGVPGDLGRRQPEGRRRRRICAARSSCPAGSIYPKYRFALILFGTFAAVALWLLYTRPRSARWCAPASTTARWSTPPASMSTACSCWSRRSPRSSPAWRAWSAARS